MEKVRRALDKVLETAGSIILVVMIVVVLYQVFTRAVLNNPSTITEEFVRFSLVWLSMLASAYVVGNKSHLAVTLLSDHLKGGSKRLLGIIVEILFVIFAIAIMIFGGGKAVSLTMGQISPSLSIPMGLIYLSVPVSGILILIYSIMNLLDMFKKNGEEE